MPGNLRDAERAATIHAQECHSIPGHTRWDQPAPYDRDSSSKTFLGAGSYRCAYRIRGVVYKVEHQWYNRGDCNATEYRNAQIARKHGLDVVPPVSQFTVKVRNHRNRLVRVVVNAMPYYKDTPKDKHGGNWYSALDRILDGTPLEHLTWDMVQNNVRCTPTGRFRIIDAADQAW